MSIFSQLTERQKQIAALMLEGLKTVEIGRRIGITSNNVVAQKSYMRGRVGAKDAESMLGMLRSESDVIAAWSEAQSKAAAERPAPRAEPLPPAVDVPPRPALARFPRNKRTVFFHTERGPARGGEA